MDKRFFSSARPLFSVLLSGLACLSLVLASQQAVQADEPAWIWTPQKSGIAGVKPQGECFFRKKFTLVGPEKAEIIFAAGDEYEIYLNGRLATRGQSFGQQKTVDVSKFILPGVNLLAAKIRHYESERVGLSLKFRVKERADIRWRSLETNDSWKTRIDDVSQWTRNTYNDMAWVDAQVLRLPAVETEANDAAKLTTKQTVPAKAVAKKTPNAKVTQGLAATASPVVSESKKVASDSASQSKVTTADQAASGQVSSVAKASSNQVDESKPEVARQKLPAPPEVAPQKLRVISRNKTVEEDAKQPSKKVADAKQRFEIDPEFKIQQIMTHEETGSVVAMEFNEFGKLLLSREGGPLMIADMSKPASHPSRIRTYCSEVNTCQGILCLNGSVYVTASGPQGLGLYRLSDSDNDGMLTVDKKLVGFTGKLGEHGPHGIQLGHDGMIYVIVGNNSQVDTTVAETSPYLNYYEGDLVPRFEDPGGHAQGVKAPGGTIIRVSLDGDRVERVAGGIRNAYDLVLDKNGEIFVHDSDMESDIGTTWYRPTMMFHVPDGSEVGWRSGWSKFPEYFADQMPPVAKTGRGSPTGAALYQHIQFPAKYHDSMFFADWSEGRIMMLKPQPSGAGFTGKTETFVKGRPLNVCDLAIGEDGGLYFCTGGRGTSGGVYRITWKGDIPEEMLQFDSDLAKVMRHPQPNAAWSRQNIAEIRVSMGDAWGPSIEGVVRETRNSSKVRVRAMQLMVLYGPSPSDSLLRELANDDKTIVRAQTARLCGLKKTAVCEQLLSEMITDKSAYVRRVVCESMIRSGVTPNYQSLLPMLASLDRAEANAARRILERIPVETWQAEILATDNNRVFINGAIAMLTSNPSLDRSYKTLARSAALMEGFVNDRDFVDMLRTMQLALIQGDVLPEKVGGLTARMVNEFPSNSSVINRELARLLGFLKAGGFDGRLESYLADEKVSTVDKVHVCMFLVHGQNNLTHNERVAIVDALESARLAKGTGGSYDQYVQRAIEGISASVAGTDIQTVLKNGHRWPKTVLTAFYKLPVQIDEATEQAVIELDQRIVESGREDHASQQVRLGVIAILARDGGKRGMDYLRQIWQAEPQRRNEIVIGLAQQPQEENWAYLVSSLTSLDDLTSIEVMEKLIAVNRRPQESKHFRDAIQIGYRVRGEGARSAAKLIQHWAGDALVDPTATWETQLKECRDWYASQFPNESAIDVPNETESESMSVAKIVDQLGRSGLGDAHRGQQLFAKAKCATCHRVNGMGEAVGPELSNLASRFSLREAVESTIKPSAVVPDRYASKTILTVDGIVFNGMAIQQPDESYFVLQADGKRVRIAKDDIEEMKDNPESAMPAGLLDGMTMAEIADLFAYLMKSTSKETASQIRPAARISAMPAVQPIR
ncbi:MAG: c-type cytochrome [Planctomycetota bacterium]